MNMSESLVEPPPPPPELMEKYGIKKTKENNTSKQEELPPIFNIPQDLAQQELAKYLSEKYGVPLPLTMSIVQQAKLDTRLMKLSEIEKKFQRILSLAGQLKDIGPITKSTVDTAVAQLVAREISSTSQLQDDGIIKELKDILILKEKLKMYSKILGSDEEETR